MKRLTALLLAALSLFALAACAKEEPSANVAADKTLEQIMEEVLKDVELPMVGNIEVNADNFKSYLFIDPVQGEALASEAMISAVAHSVVLLRVGENEDAAKIAAEIQSNADPRKWICVEAESTQVVQRGDLILLVMSAKDTADAIVQNFNALV